MIEARRGAVDAITVRTSFDDFYREHFRSMTRLAASISGSAVVAEDIVQDAFSRIYPRFDRLDRPEAYLRRAVVNGCTSRFRKHRRERLVERHDDQAAPGAETGEAHAIGERLALLNERQRAVVVLRIQHGLSEAETAELMGCRPGTVGSLLHRALKVLRAEELRDAEEIDR